MPEPLDPELSPTQQNSVLVAYERTLRAMPAYELKAEYIARFGGTWDGLPRPRQESAIAALVQNFANQNCSRLDRVGHIVRSSELEVTDRDTSVGPARS